MASTYLTRTPSSAGNRKTFTFSTWFKLGSVDTTKYFISSYSASSDSGYTHFSVQNNNKLHFAGNTTDFRTSTQLLRDLSSWYHVVLAVDTTQATASDRIKIYLNGSQITDFTNNNNPNQNDDFAFNQNAIDMVVGSANAGGSKGAYWDGSMAHVHWIDGTQYQASDFGETDATTGIWKPKTAPSVTYGTNGFFLKFENSGAFGTDSSGNANNFTVNGTMTQTIDTPSNVFATLNPLIIFGANNSEFKEGNLVYDDNRGDWRAAVGTFGVQSGKWYWEMKLGSGTFHQVGIVGTTSPTSSANLIDLSQVHGGYSFYNDNGNLIARTNGGTISGWDSGTVGTSASTGDILMVALDMDNKFLYFGKNGTWVKSGDPTSGPSGTGAINISSDFTTGIDALPGVSMYSGSDGSLNFGNGYFGTTAVSSAQNPDDGIGIFEYDVPTGYRALCTKSINAEEYS
jgi:hypothetical protein